jgi:NADH-quinone oxidoreductase subunit N
LSLSEQLQHIGQSLTGIYPELFLVVFFLAALILELALPHDETKSAVSRPILVLHWIGAVTFLGLLAWQMEWAERRSLFGHMLELTDQSIFFKALVGISWLITLFHIQKLNYRFQPVFFVLLATAVLGASLLCMASNLLMVYLSIEIISLSSYLLVGLSPYAKASEGGLKYLLFGAISSAIMLYGISFIYGLTGTLDLGPELWTSLDQAPSLVLMTTSLLVLGGLLFKLSLIPFHIWTPDTYEATPTPIVSFLSAVPKIAVLLALVKLVESLPEATLPLLGGIALISMTAGNVGALRQDNARRLMAYSTIAQAGYLIVGILILGKTGVNTATFYLIAYMLLSMSAFLLIDLFAPQTDTALKQLEGKGKLWTIGGIAVIVVMVGLAGLPPTIGFTGKWLIFSALWESYSTTGERWKFILLTGGILNAAISLAYYLKIPYLLFFKEIQKTEEGQTAPSLNGLSSSLVAALVIFLALLFFFQPQLLLDRITGL